MGDRTTAIGKNINEYLQNGNDLNDQAIHLLFSANRWECMNEIKALLESGTTVVLDRYAFSGVAYSVAKVLYCLRKGLDIEWCKAPDRGLLVPDIVLFFDLDPEIAKSRGNYGEERYETLQMQSKARDAFHLLSTSDPPFTIINADQSIESLQQTVYKHISILLDKKPGPLRFELWKK